MRVRLFQFLHGLGGSLNRGCDAIVVPAVETEDRTRGVAERIVPWSRPVVHDCGLEFWLSGGVRERGRAAPAEADARALVDRGWEFDRMLHRSVQSTRRFFLGEFANLIGRAI